MNNPNLAYAFRKGEGEREHRIFGQDFVRLASESTTGAFALFEISSTQGCGPPYHQHSREDEAFYVLDGRFRVQVGSRTINAEPGTWIYCPRDVPHGYVVLTHVGKHLTYISPAGLEAFFEAVEEESNRSNGNISLDRMVRLNAEFGVTVLGPPLSL